MIKIVPGSLGIMTDEKKLPSVLKHLRKQCKKKPSRIPQKIKNNKFYFQPKSRQEFEPPIGKLVDRIHVDPLHLKNNACALAHPHLLSEVLLLSQLSNSVHAFSQAPNNSPFATYINTMRNKCHLIPLANKVVRWFDESKRVGSNFDRRFSNSRCFVQNFMFLIKAMRPF